MAQTRFFTTTRGVFQGGGCRAAAFAGAFEAAHEHGVSFSEVAGTSAGAITAALIGAGATPSQVSEFLEELDFRQFLVPAGPRMLTKPGLLVAKHGVYSSTPIQHWMEKRLSSLTGQPSPVKFSDLAIPTLVVATDLVRRATVTWGAEHNGSVDVALAVRCSCTIPLFFAPVHGRYVDGGLLSNLPSFVFNASHDEGNVGRILAFCLADDSNPTEASGIWPYLQSLANTVVSGSQGVQSILQPNVHVIRIPTGPIRATDFDAMDTAAIATLTSSGRDATKAFFRNELANVRSIDRATRAIADREQMFAAFVDTIDGHVEEVCISDANTDFVFSLFLSLLRLGMQGAKMRVLL